MFCKFLLAVSAFLAASSAFASSDWYRNNFWPGEYPQGVVTQKYFSELGRRQPSLSSPHDVRCELPEGMILHEWNRKSSLRNTEFVYNSRIEQFEAQVDFERQVNENTVVSIRKGDRVEGLGYLAEGHCLFRAGGTVYSDACPGDSEGEFYVRLPESREGYELWIGLTCLGGERAYFLLQAGDEREVAEEADAEIVRNMTAGLVTSMEMIREYGKAADDNLILRSEVNERALTEALNADSLAGRVGQQYRVERVEHLSRVGFAVSVSRTLDGQRVDSTEVIDYRGRSINRSRQQ